MDTIKPARYVLLASAPVTGYLSRITFRGRSISWTNTE